MLDLRAMTEIGIPGRQGPPRRRLIAKPEILVGSSEFGDIGAMRVTTWTEYSLIISLHLAKRGRTSPSPVAARELADAERLPPDYVEQILLRLRRAGLVESVRGARGGYIAGPATRRHLGARRHAPPPSTRPSRSTATRTRSTASAAPASALQHPADLVRAAAAHR